MSEDKVQRAVQQAITADRERHRQVMALPEARGRKALAEQLFLSDRSLEEIRAELAAAPSATTRRVLAGLRARGFGSSNK